ncbi:MAG: choice-of-anchor tandem repeat GloVer-containing protein, partial [Candidatus Cybelea sp.]
FTCGSDGGDPMAGLTEGENGALYGTADGGGNSCYSSGCGTVYELTPTSIGYAFSVLWRFQSNGDGNMPDSELLPDATGALYGTTTRGGLSGSSNGTVFKVVP